MKDVLHRNHLLEEEWFDDRGALEVCDVEQGVQVGQEGVAQQQGVAHDLLVGRVKHRRVLVLYHSIQT